ASGSSCHQIVLFGKQVAQVGQVVDDRRRLIAEGGAALRKCELEERQRTLQIAVLDERHRARGQICICHRLASRCTSDIVSCPASSASARRKKNQRAGAQCTRPTRTARSVRGMSTPCCSSSSSAMASSSR